MVWTVPNTLTLLRIALIPVLVVVFYLPFAWSNLASTAVFGLAALTDWLDGYLARRMQLVSALGAFLDPVADKLMVATALVLLVQADPSILILDEATSSVDTRTELLIQRALDQLMANRSSLVIAHRLSTIRHADQILVIEKNRVVERGSHETLLDKGGVYHGLYMSQFRRQETEE